MALGLLIAGIVTALAGLFALVLGAMLELSLGNTLILAGAVAVCSGLILVGVSATLRELQKIASRLAGPGANAPVRPVIAAAGPAQRAGEGGPFQPGRAEPSLGLREMGAAASSEDMNPEPDRAEDFGDGANAAPAEPRQQRRNLLFASISRKDRERGDLPAAGRPDITRPDAPHPSFDDAWPKADRIKEAEQPAFRRPASRPIMPDEPPAMPGVVRQRPQPPRQPVPEPPQVTVLKSGVVDGMAYSLYSDGSIEAQMPEGMMRFGSIDELRAHLDQKS